VTRPRSPRHRRGAAYVLPHRIRAQYQFTIDFMGSAIADDPEQHKSLHVCLIEGGLIGASGPSQFSIRRPIARADRRS
jgi:hypothetical protein